jgi:hypothetical protein
MIARSFNEVTTGIRDRARSGSPVRRNSHNAGGDRAVADAQHLLED